MGDVVSGGLQLVGAISQGNAAKAQGEARKEELDREAQLTKIAAEQSQTSRLTELQKTLGAISALTATRNIDASSPSAFAYRGGVANEAYRSIQNEAFNASQQASAMNLAGRVAAQTGAAAQWSSYLSGAGQFIKGVDDAFAKAATAGG